jgi:hypothetical protein
LNTVYDFLTERNVAVDEEVSSTILQHLHDLRSCLVEYFPMPNDDNAFVITAKPVSFNVHV